MFNKVNPSLFRPLLTLVFALGVTFGYGLKVGINKAISVTEQKERQTQTEFQYVTRVDYEQLKPKMSLTDVQAILDQGIEINHSETTATFLWQNSNGSYITVTFKNGKLTSKAQSKLK